MMAAIADMAYVGDGGLCGSLSDSINCGGAFAPRGWTALGAVQQLRSVPEVGSVTDISGDCAAFGNAPSAIDGRLVHGRMLIKDAAAGAPIRAIIPGVRYIPQKGAGALYANDPYVVVPAGASLPGRNLAAVPVKHHVMSGSDQGLCFVDVTGPWR